MRNGQDTLSNAFSASRLSNIRGAESRVWALIVAAIDVLIFLTDGLCLVNPLLEGWIMEGRKDCIRVANNLVKNL